MNVRELIDKLLAFDLEEKVLLKNSLGQSVTLFDEIESLDIEGLLDGAKFSRAVIISAVADEGIDQTNATDLTRIDDDAIEELVQPLTDHEDDQDTVDDVETYLKSIGLDTPQE